MAEAGGPNCRQRRWGDCGYGTDAISPPQPTSKGFHRFGSERYKLPQRSRPTGQIEPRKLILGRSVFLGFKNHKPTRISTPTSMILRWWWPQC